MVAGHLSVSELETRFRAAKDTVEKSHLQVIWLLAKGHSKGEVAQITALSPRWTNKLLQRMPRMGPRRWATCATRTGAQPRSLMRPTWRPCGSAWRPRPRMAGCGAGARWRPGSPSGAGWSRCTPSVAGRH